MKTLILSVDRDDDLGRKAGTSGPVLGREAVLAAAQALALADPEDSDANCLFGAVSTLDELVRDAEPGRTYEVAAVTGHRKVGPKSDAVLVSQVDRLLTQVRPDRLILVSDGAEDEHILPLLESRIKIDSVRRIVIQQAPNLKGAFYLFIRLFEDERVQKKFVLPVSIAIIVFGLAFATKQVPLAIGAGLVTLGSILLIHAMHWEARIARVARDFYAGLKTGKVSFFTTVFALALIVFGSLRAYSDLHHDPVLSNPYIVQANEDPLLFTVLFLRLALWWVIAGLILNILGRALDELVRFRSTKGIYWRLSFGLLSVGFIMEGLLLAATLWRGGVALTRVVAEQEVWSNIIVGVIIALVGSLTYRYVRETLRDDEEEEGEPSGERIPMRRRRAKTGEIVEGRERTAPQEGS